MCRVSASRSQSFAPRDRVHRKVRASRLPARLSNLHGYVPLFGLGKMELMPDVYGISIGFPKSQPGSVSTMTRFRSVSRIARVGCSNILKAHERRIGVTEQRLIIQRGNRVRDVPRTRDNGNRRRVVRYRVCCLTRRYDGIKCKAVGS